MTLPPDLGIARVKEAHLKLAETENEECIHPERLVVAMPYSQAKTFQHLVSKMNQRPPTC